MNAEAFRQTTSILAAAISFLAEEIQRAGISDAPRAAAMLDKLERMVPDQTDAAKFLIDGLRRGMTGRV